VKPKCLFLILGLSSLPIGAKATAGSVATYHWSSDFTAKVEALALMQSLNAQLLSHDSATLTLDHWCAAHKLAAPALIVAQLVHDLDKPATAEQRQLLKVGPNETIRYRRVNLRCGDLTLSKADNWYVPSRLSDEMNKQLDATDIAFGRAVQALHFQRHTISAKLLWSPLSEGWETARQQESDSKGPLEIPDDLIQHSAVLTLPDGTPFSEVVETYTSSILNFAEPPRP